MIFRCTCGMVKTDPASWFGHTLACDHWEVRYGTPTPLSRGPRVEYTEQWIGWLPARRRRMKIIDWHRMRVLDWVVLAVWMGCAAVTLWIMSTFLIR